MNANEVDVKLKQALVKMHVYERDHNKVAFIHTKEILQLIYEHAPIDEKDLKSMLRISASIDKRYITQYLEGFRVWGVIFRENGIIYANKPLECSSVEQKEQTRQTEIIESSTCGIISKCDYIKSNSKLCGRSGEVITEKLCEGCERK